MKVLLPGISVALFACATHAQIEIDSNTFGSMEARSIGPAVMSGRISAIDGIAGSPTVLYVGSASGGLWKSDDGGIDFDPVFDDDNPQSIGAVRVDPNAPETVWVGTGEPWVRNSVSVGDGVYRSTDGGDSWQHMGLTDSERIGAIRISSLDGNVVFVCALGHLWSDNEERGVFRTTDGGENWEKVLYVDQRTGCADLDLDPTNPNIIYAGMWEHRRYPDFFESGGPGSALYRSLDGGDTWQEMTAGLPEGPIGRTAIAIAPSRPTTVYATVEAEETALYRSDDMGREWRKMDTSSNIQMRPFYFSELVIDPTDHERVYKPGFTLTVSVDGGDSFSSMFGPGFSISIHPDHHALWIDPTDPKTLFLGTDGGVYASYDYANHWRLIGQLPVSQFYHVSHDDAWPYNVYGGLQDNGSWTGPSQAPGGIQAKHWDNVGFGDGFWVFADKADPNTIYSEYQGGQLLRVNRSIGEIKRIAPVARDDEEKLRFNWNTPLQISHHSDTRLFYGSQYLHVSDDRGESWRTISPDLTTDSPERQRQEKSGGISIDNTTAENNASLYTISESPLDADLIWTGSDDGRLHVTKDGGESWTDLSRNIPEVPRGTWVSRVEASPHDASTAFVTFDGHRDGNMRPYVFKTIDGGATWQSLVSDDIEGYAWVVKQDPVNPDLLFLGTEFGLYITLDGGTNWARFKGNLPKVAVHDIVIHPREHDVILGTHGRGVYIIDDILPLRSLTAENLDQSVTLLPSRPATMVAGGQLQAFGANESFVGNNPPQAATITYYMKRRHLFGDLVIHVYDADDELITTIPGSKRKGINRVEWPMRLKPPKFPPATSLVPGFLGPRVPEGAYRIELIKGKETVNGEVSLVADPRSPHDKADRLLQQSTTLDLYGLLADLTYLSESMTSVKDALAEVLPELSGGDARRVQSLIDELDTFNKTLVVTDSSGVFGGQQRLRERLGELYGNVSSYDGRPSDTQLEQLESLRAELAAAQDEAQQLLAEPLKRINKDLEDRSLEPITRPTREEWNADDAAGGSIAGPMKRQQWSAMPQTLSAMIRGL